MPYLLAISFVVNVILVLACIKLVQRWKESDERDQMAVQLLRDELQHTIAGRDFCQRGLRSMAAAVAITLREVKDDIERNYATNGEEVLELREILGGLAHHLDAESVTQFPVVPVSAPMAAKLKLRGIVVESGVVHLGELLALAWTVHADARTSAGRLYEVLTRWSGGDRYPYRSAQQYWLAKSLAQYASLCSTEISAATELQLVAGGWKWHLEHGTHPREAIEAAAHMAVNHIEAQAPVAADSLSSNVGPDPVANFSTVGPRSIEV